MCSFIPWGSGPCRQWVGGSYLPSDPWSASFSPAACKESKRPLEVSQRSEEMGLILGICAGGLAVLILLLGAIIIIIRKG